MGDFIVLYAEGNPSVSIGGFHPFQAKTNYVKSVRVGGITLRKIEYRNCEKCGQKYTTNVHSKINLCFHCWKPEWKL